MTDITVPVPNDRTAEFYQFFGLWLGGSLQLPDQGPADPSGALKTSLLQGSTPKAAAMVPWGITERDHADALQLWKKYSPRARAMFSLLIDNRGKMFTGDQIAEAVNIPNGAHGVAGVLAWPGRYGMAIGRGLPTEWRENPETLELAYSIPTERAELFKVAREQVERTR